MTSGSPDDRPLHLQLDTAVDYWLEIAEPDVSESSVDRGNLRKALHAATSLTHMADWVFHTHKDDVSAKFNVKNEVEFANSLAQTYPHFDRIRGVANAAKHLVRRDTFKPTHGAPAHGSDTGVRHGGFQANAFQNNGFATSKVIVIGSDGQEYDFHEMMRATYNMWRQLKAENGW